MLVLLDYGCEDKQKSLIAESLVRSKLNYLKRLRTYNPLVPGSSPGGPTNLKQ